MSALRPLHAGQKITVFSVESRSMELCRLNGLRTTAAALSRGRARDGKKEFLETRNNHFPDLCLLQSLHNIWQFSAVVFPPECHGVMWSPSVSSISTIASNAFDISVFPIAERICFNILHAVLYVTPISRCNCKPEISFLEFKNKWIALFNGSSREKR